MSEEHYLPMDCPNCGRQRLLYEGPGSKVRCEKCGRDEWDSSEWPYPGQPGESGGKATD